MSKTNADPRWAFLDFVGSSGIVLGLGVYLERLSADFLAGAIFGSFLMWMRWRDRERERDQ